MVGKPEDGAPQAADPASEEGAQEQRSLQVLNRNASIMQQIVASRRAELDSESAMIAAPADEASEESEPSDSAPAAEAPEEPAPETTEAPTDDEMVDVVVDGRRLRVAKQEVEEAGGVEPYQKMRAATARLDYASRVAREAEERERALEARARALGLDPATMQPVAGPMTPPAHSDAPGSTSGQQPRRGSGASGAEVPPDVAEVIDEFSESVALASSKEEIAKSVTKLVDRLKPNSLGPADIEAVIANRDAQMRSREDLESFAKDNPEIAGSTALFGATRFLARGEMIEDLRKLPNLTQEAKNFLDRASDAQIGEWHLAARRDGMGRSLRTIFDTAAEQVRSEFKLAKPTTSSKDADGSRTPAGGSAKSPVAPGVTERRRALKGVAVVATSTPVSSASASPPPSARRPQTPSEYINEMRKRRGLTPYPVAR